jgi:hypothetical protein
MINYLHKKLVFGIKKRHFKNHKIGPRFATSTKTFADYFQFSCLPADVAANPPNLAAVVDLPLRIQIQMPVLGSASAEKKENH